MSFETIVVATDLTETSCAAVEYARKLAVSSGARIVLAHGIDPLAYADINGLPVSVLSDLTEKARGAIEKLKDELLSKGIRSHSEVRQGTVVELLLDVVRQYQAGLLVIGTRGVAGAGPVLLGSVAEQLVRLAPCPILAVAADALPASEFSTGSNCVIPVERNDASVRAIAAAREVAELFGLGLLLVHARTQAEAEAKLDPCAETFPQVRFPAGKAQVSVRCMVRDGNPADVVKSIVDQYPTALIVLGVNRESRTGGPHGTAYEVMAKAKVPVLCIPPEVIQSMPAQIGEVALC
jgi:nucleotide-binding universal stress UspA family protein